MKLRLATYNLHKCRGITGPHDPLRNLAAIRAVDPDAIALQEVDFRFGARPEALPRALIERETGLVPVDLTGTTQSSLGWHGQTILMRPDLAREVRVRRLPLPGLEPRGAVAAMLPEITMVAVHLGLTRSARRAQLARLAMQSARLGAEPTVLTGDFNEWADAKGLEALAGFQLISPGPSWPALRPQLRYDRFALSPQLEVLDQGVEAGEDARRASDHLPVWVDVEVG
ncbi:endonuclease [Paracoccus sp. S-4012]|uniref:endonuclease/exonuclease/phosphatase family protein n=1 Tax=Paracoccus sp. S-4012 TaxID=2665648 RepID=UPI0012AF39AB|nr:endonuclease/exonuclease/phosphatase family protein [Paracoccus sp. S-4012]MRX51838.1 endonuclease [Paracoccus sp. S-4012]